MRTLNLLILLVLFASNLHGQVGIGTTDPHSSAALDVNGKLRIQELERGTDGAAKDSLLVIDGRGIIYRIPTSDLLSNMDKSLVKASFSGGGSSISLSLGSGETDVVFNNELFDIKNEYDPVSGEFTAQSDGIFRIGTLLRYSNVISLSTTNVRIYKNSVLIAEGFTSNANEYKFDFLTSLSTGDIVTIRFYRSGLALSLNLLTGEENGYLDIEQIR